MSTELFLNLSSGFKIPIVGLGTSKTSDEEIEKALNLALEIGYRHLDSAYYYRNDHVIRKVLQKWFQSGKLTRNEVFVTSKLPFMGVHPDFVEGFLDKSLQEMGLDYLDLYLIHFPIFADEVRENGKVKFVPKETDLVAVWRKLGELVDKGKIRSIGVSNFNLEQIERIIKSNPKHKISNIQIEVHVYFQQQELVKFCQKNGIVVTAYAPLGSPGYSKYLVSVGFPAKENLPDILNDQKIRQVSEKHKKTPAQVALKYLLQNNIVVVPKSVSESRLRENFDLFDFHLDEDDMGKLRSLDLGEDGRIFTYVEYDGFQEHPEWPFKKNCKI